MPWGSFPSVLANDRMGSLRWDAKDVEAPEYIAAKEQEDWQAAMALVQRKLKPGMIQKVGDFLRNTCTDPARLEIVPVDAIEAGGKNKIPLAIARTLSEHLDNIRVNTEVKQADKVGRSGAGINHRLAFMPSFAGRVECKDYFIVDDTLRVGGTLANVRGYIMASGGNVLGAFVMQADEQSRILQPGEKIYNKLYTKHGREESDAFCKQQFGFDTLCLTRGEAGNIAAAKSLADIAGRIEHARNDSSRIRREIGRIEEKRSAALNPGGTGHAATGIQGIPDSEALTSAAHSFHELASAFWQACEQDSSQAPFDAVLGKYPELADAVTARKIIACDELFRPDRGAESRERLRLATGAVCACIAQGDICLNQSELIETIKAMALKRHRELDRER